MDRIEVGDLVYYVSGVFGKKYCIVKKIDKGDLGRTRIWGLWDTPKEKAIEKAKINNDEESYTFSVDNSVYVEKKMIIKNWREVFQK